MVIEAASFTTHATRRVAGGGLWPESLLTALLVLAVLQFGGPIEATIGRGLEQPSQPPTPPSESP